MRLYIGNLGASITEDDLLGVFKEYKLYGDCSIIKSNKKAFAIVHVEDGERAIAELDGSVLKGSLVKVLKAVDRATQCPQALMATAPKKSRK